MDNSRVLTILLISLVLAGLVVGYFLLRNTFLPRTKPQVQPAPPTTQVSPASSTPSNFVLGQNTQSPTPASNTTFSTISTTSPTASSAFSKIAQRTQGNTNALPATGFQIALTGLFSASIIIIGWKLRKYPH